MPSRFRNIVRAAERKPDFAQLGAATERLISGASIKLGEDQIRYQHWRIVNAELVIDQLSEFAHTHETTLTDPSSGAGKVVRALELRLERPHNEMCVIGGWDTGLLPGK